VKRITVYHSRTWKTEQENWTIHCVSIGNRVADPDLGSSAFLNHGSEIRGIRDGKIIRIRDNFFESLENSDFGMKILKFFDADPGSF
jgi:hypothetical protein